MKFLALQPLTSKDLPEVVELDRRCLGGLWTKAGYQREIESPNSDLLILRAVNHLQGQAGAFDGVIGVACLWAILEEAHVTLLAVDPPYQQQGLGQLLLYALLVSAWQRGLEWATLEVRVSNQAAISLYQKVGFQSVGERRNYYQDTGENALILWRKGLQHPEFQNYLMQWRRALGDRLQQAGWYLSAFPDMNWNPSTVKLSVPS